MSKTAKTLEVINFTERYNNSRRPRINPLIDRFEYNEKDDIYDVYFGPEGTIDLHMLESYKEIPFRIKLKIDWLIDISIGDISKPSMLKSLKNFPAKGIRRLQIVNCPDLESFGDVEHVEAIILDGTCNFRNFDNIPKAINLYIDSDIVNKLENVDGIIGKIKYVQLEGIYYEAEKFVRVFKEHYFGRVL